MEFLRNRERYEFLKWGQKAFANFRVVPPMTGIVHQVNLENLASVVGVRSLPTSAQNLALTGCFAKILQSERRYRKCLPKLPR